LTLPRVYRETMAEPVAKRACGEWPVLDDAEIATFLEKVPLWELVEEDGVKKIRRDFVAKGFQPALDFVVGAGAAAEARGHHPDLHLTSYRNVSVGMCQHVVLWLHLFTPLP
jgi:4a-hydroxytetrahydrobiopterin dehydratase